MSEMSQTIMAPVEHWNGDWPRPSRIRLPIGLNVTTRNLQRLPDVSMDHVLPARPVRWSINHLGLMQPRDLCCLCPMQAQETVCRVAP